MFAPTRLAYALRPAAPPALIGAAAAVAAMFAATPFLIPEISTRYGVSEGLAGAISVAQVGAFATTTLLLPRYFSPSGRMLQAAALTLLAANALSAVPNVYWMLIVIRLIAGVAAGALTWVSWADAMRQPRSLAGVASAGPVTALLATPLISVLASFGDRAVYIALAVSALPVVLLKSETMVEVGRRERVSRSRSNRVLLAALLLLSLSGASLFTFLAVAAREQLGLSAMAASLGFSLNAAAGLLGTRFASRHRRPGWWLASAGPAAYLTVGGEQAWLFFLGMAWWGFAFWMGVPGVLTMLSERSLEPGERAGDAQALMAIGRALAPLLGGRLVDADAYTTLAGVAGVGVMLSGMTVIGVQEGRGRLPPTDPRVLARP